MCYFIDVDNCFQYEVLDFTPALMPLPVYEMGYTAKLSGTWFV